MPVLMSMLCILFVSVLLSLFFNILRKKRRPNNHGTEAIRSDHTRAVPNVSLPGMVRSGSLPDLRRTHREVPDDALSRRSLPADLHSIEPTYSEIPDHVAAAQRPLPETPHTYWQIPDHLAAAQRPLPPIPYTCNIPDESALQEQTGTVYGTAGGRMVGYDPQEKVELSATEYAVAGGVSGFLTRAACNPLDVIKIRFQVCQLLSLVYGAVQVCQLLSLVYGAVQFAVFELLTKQAWEQLPPEASSGLWKPALHFMCGGLSAMAATCACQPVDVLRTRFSSQGEPKVYRSLPQAISSMWREGGPRAFYRGLSPTLVQIFPYAGFQFATFAMFTSAWEYLPQSISDKGAVKTLVCGAASGVVSKTLVYPLDVVKKRLQVQGFDHARRSFGQVREYTGPVHCVRCMLREEGARGLFKGLSPSLLKAACTLSLMFSLYEQCCHALRLSHHVYTYR
uniref:Uncharacterized protein n=1 Tax=Branchiostoma floridae TaxID=7739 RepID=C3ZJU5_BRAFL|eukprot:XP_002591219.1 hypothetical protein BRAFLDRAFT_131411 [Branchiostoma floridae]